MLRKRTPSLLNPIRLYASTTENLSNICYTAEIIGWEDKRELSAQRRKEVRAYLQKYQPNEISLFEGVEEVGKAAVNLVTIQNLQKLDSLYATNILKKASDELPLKKRTRSGGWSYVYDVGDLLTLPATTREQNERELLADIEASFSRSAAERAKRLAAAAKLPLRVQIISVGFRRNAEVIVTVLTRANGVCEGCGNNAPFNRRSDGTPYLEVHHRIALSARGEDTVENANALCPNCHRKEHHA